jgi:hypothetical protein
MFAHKFSGKRNIFCVSLKKKKFDAKNMTIHGTFFVFLHRPHKMFFYLENLCTNIECPDVYAKFIFDFFIFQNLFFTHFS